MFADNFRADWAVPRYFLHVDPGEGKPSNFGIVLGHLEKAENIETGERDSIVVIDLAYAVAARNDGEVDFIKAREILDIIISRFPVVYTSDRWNDVEYIQRIKGRVKGNDRLTVSWEHYEALKTTIYGRKIKIMHDSSLAKEELKRLGLRNGNKVVKGTGCTKDVADGLAAVTYNCLVGKFKKKMSSGRLATGVFGR